MVGHGSRLRSSLMIQQHITTTRASQDERASPSVAGGGRWISVDLLAGYRYAQVLAPKDKDWPAGDLHSSTACHEPPSWSTEAPLRLLMNNLDPEVAERPQELAVYGGIGRAARNWECFDRIVATLKQLGQDQTSLVQSASLWGSF